ncbi:hypothetical protein BDM02DRAFT_3271586 [Thelephora ganbajun]|uniref:Uncharacterized protein n=1 Tax=Thelephora ganbajun TaxID=370292 RepID=A0ACB6Z8E5_THEGA|nr:hypothetical protein BDM02DRAFT_3271586 [Thelephora ganbajun]
MATHTPLPLREALNDCISSGRFIDTKIILYSRRGPSDTACRPRALYANSHVLKTVPYFSTLLSGTFAEAESKDFSQPIDEDECTESYGYCSDSDLEDEDDAVKVGETSKKAVPLRGHPFDPFCFPIDDKESAPACGEHKECAGKGTVIKVHDVAFITFQALLVYLYTSHINFAPYGSEENRKSRSSEIVSLSEGSIPRPSPKSIYRLADKYDLPLLKRLALDNIRDGLKQCDTVEEVFSRFSSKYEDIRTMQVNHLASVLSSADEVSAKDLCGKVDEMVDNYANGDLDHAMDAIILLWKLAKEPRRSPPASPVARSSVRPTSGPANQRCLEIALIKSIREGVFLDRKYWTRHSKTAKVLRPVYISSIVIGERLRYIDSLVKPHREEESFDTAGGSEDSDCENSSEQASESVPEEQADRKEEVERQTLSVLTVGSFASWRSLFFYLCTDVIQFAPLKSQGTDMRAQYVREQTTPDEPPPCSPRVIYSLASALDIKPLRDLAFDDIRSKVTSTNVVTELFSSFASRQGDVAKMQCRLLYDNFNNTTTTEKGVEFIESMLGGNLAHRAGALKLGLREGLLGGVFLRCPREDCDMHNNTIPHHLLGLRCPESHRGRAPYLECASCGDSRTDSEYTSCDNCGKRFR